MSVGFGVDTYGWDSLTPGKYASGPALVAQAIYRRLITPRGTLVPIDDGNGGHEEDAYGFDVSSYVGAVGYATAAQTLAQIAIGEIKKDDRVDPSSLTGSAVLSADDNTGSQSITLTIAGSLADASGDFKLTLAVSALTVGILTGTA